SGSGTLLLRASRQKDGRSRQPDSHCQWRAAQEDLHQDNPRHQLGRRLAPCEGCPACWRRHDCSLLRRHEEARHDGPGQNIHLGPRRGWFVRRHGELGRCQGLRDQGGQEVIGPGACHMRVLICCTVLFLELACSARAENWPGWRGPRGDGTSAEKDLPTTWSPKENVRWKVKLPGPGNSSP